MVDVLGLGKSAKYVQNWAKLASLKQCPNFEQRRFPRTKYH